MSSRYLKLYVSRDDAGSKQPEMGIFFGRYDTYVQKSNSVLGLSDVMVDKDEPSEQPETGIFFGRHKPYVQKSNSTCGLSEVEFDKDEPIYVTNTHYMFYSLKEELFNWADEGVTEFTMFFESRISSGLEPLYVGDEIIDMLTHNAHFTRFSFKKEENNDNGAGIFIEMKVYREKRKDSIPFDANGYISSITNSYIYPKLIFESALLVVDGYNSTNDFKTLSEFARSKDAGETIDPKIPTILWLRQSGEPHIMKKREDNTNCVFYHSMYDRKRWESKASRAVKGPFDEFEYQEIAAGLGPYQVIAFDPKTKSDFVKDPQSFYKTVCNKTSVTVASEVCLIINPDKTIHKESIPKHLLGNNNVSAVYSIPANQGIFWHSGETRITVFIGVTFVFDGSAKPLEDPASIIKEGVESFYDPSGFISEKYNLYSIKTYTIEQAASLIAWDVLRPVPNDKDLQWGRRDSTLNQ